MRLSLGFKIITAITLVNLLALTAAVGFGNRNMRGQYGTFALQKDLNMAERMVGFINRMSVDQTTSQMEEIVQYLHLEQQRRPHMMGMMRDGRMNHRRSPPPRELLEENWLLTDAEGRIVFSTSPIDGQEYPVKANQPLGAPIIKNGTPIGYFYVGRMIRDTRLFPNNAFLEIPGRINWMVSAIIFFITVILGALLTRHIVIPIKALNQATAQVKDGNLTTRVESKRQDEMGDLARGFNSMTCSLEDADRQRRQFISNAAHELRTPISLIRTRIEMMEEGVYPMDNQNLGVLSEECNRLVTLTDELKLLSTLETADMPLEITRFNPSQLIDHLIKAEQPVAHKYNINLDTEIMPNLPDIQADKGKIYQLLANLISNALRYAKSRILVSMILDRDNQIEIRIEDDGVGIPPSDRERIFERFYRVDLSRSRESGGSGLGLSICRQIVQKHGGQILADQSEKMGGALLQILFPSKILC